MWPRLFLTAAIITTVVGGVSAQTGTADGVAALARGDYQRAAEILKPIAEDLRTNDTAAQFFMAGLYETGRGVRADPLRACALYMRAASNHDNPFGQEALSLFPPRALAAGSSTMNVIISPTSGSTMGSSLSRSTSGLDTRLNGP